jgi:hypothetical protein
MGNVRVITVADAVRGEELAALRSYLVAPRLKSSRRQNMLDGDSVPVRNGEQRFFHLRLALGWMLGAALHDLAAGLSKIGRSESGHSGR